MPALIVSYTSHPGGAERILVEHATAIGDDVIVACPPGWLADRLRDQGVRVFPLRERPLELRGQAAAAALHIAGHAREVRALNESLRPHTLVAWGMRAALACAAATRGSQRAQRFVFQHNDLLPGPAVAAAVRAAAARADQVIALSQAIADDLGRADTIVIRPGVDLDTFKPRSPADTRDHALFLGAITAWKRPELAIEAAALAGVPLVVAGAPLDAEGERLEERLRPAASGATTAGGGKVTFAGRVDDPAATLADAAVLLHCADREPYGMALVEALACGVPVVAPAAGGPKEITDDSCAKLYRPGDAHAAAAALIAALEQRDSLATAARARAERHFDIRHSRSRYAELFPQRATATAPDTKLAIVTVLHNSETEIAALVASIDRHLPRARLIAVDSASTDNGAEQVRDGTVIRLDENVGYGRGTNIGIEQVTEPVTVILNPDVELLDDSVAAIAEEAEKHPDRILAPLVLLPDGRRQDNVHPPGENLPGIQRPWQANEPKRVGWAVGCALVARTDTLRKLGPFDPTAFLYGEDLELGLRAREQGIETWFWPHARVLHHRAHSTAHAFDGEPFELLAERRRAVIEQRRGTKARRKDDVVQGATFASRIAAKALLRRPNDREKRQLRALLKVSRRDPPTR